MDFGQLEAQRISQHESHKRELEAMNKDFVDKIQSFWTAEQIFSDETFSQAEQVHGVRQTSTYVIGKEASIRACVDNSDRVAQFPGCKGG